MYVCMCVCVCVCVFACVYVLPRSSGQHRGLSLSKALGKRDREIERERGGDKKAKRINVLQLTRRTQSASGRPV